MADQRQIPLTGRDGKLGWVNLDEQPAGGQDALVRLEDGRAVRIPSDLLVRQPDGSFYLPMSTQQFRAANPSQTDADRETIVIPVLAEEMAVSKRQVTTGRVQINKRVHEREEVVDIPVLHHEVQVERVPVDRMVETAPQVRYEGDTMIIPVLEEVLVVEKRLHLKEEVRVTRVKVEAHESHPVTLREESVEVNRLEGDQRIGKEH